MGTFAAWGGDETARQVTSVLPLRLAEDVNLNVFGNVVGHGRNQFPNLDVIPQIEHEVFEEIGLTGHILVMTLQTCD